jgi:FkbM family methyltransferase
MAGSIIFAGCVRDCAPHLQQVLANCARLAATTEKAFFLFAENDSADATKAILANWCEGRVNAHILCFDGLHARLPKRTERIAFLRNRILAAIRERGLSDYDALCVLDFDEVNAGTISPDGFRGAVEFLFSAPDNAGVFAVSDPIYYDIYALRHEHWSPGDCWKAVRTAPDERRAEVFQTLICDRQVPIAKTTAPIAVDSAFGGFGLYRLANALDASYLGLDSDGEETCEHVSFNADIRRRGGQLHIFPGLRNNTPWQHCLNGRAQKTIRLGNGPLQMELVAPQSHQLDQYLSSYPLYDRRLPLLLTVFNRLVGAATVLDIGANILDTIALMRLSGVQLTKSICVDAALEFYKYAEFNAARNPVLGATNEIVWGFVGAEEDRGNIAAVNGTGNVRELRHRGQLQALLEPRRVTFADLAPDGVDLVKTDVDGYDHVVVRQNLAWLKRWKPMLWVEAQIEDGADVSTWSSNLLALSEDFPYVAAFDNFGFCLCAGAMIDKWNTVLDLISIGARYKAHETSAGRPRFYYLDILFVPQRLAEVFQEFVGALPEMKLTAQPPVPVKESHARAG